MAPSARKSTFTDDLRNQPAYPLSEVARYVKLPAATLRSWVLGRRYPTTDGGRKFHPIIDPAQSRPIALSFNNLIEAHVLRSLRMEHAVSIREVRQAISYAERELDIDRLLLSKKLLTQAGKLFLEEYGKLIHLSASGQIALRQLFDEHLKRVEWDARDFPVRLFPFVTSTASNTDRPIAIDPAVSFGRPIIVSRGISTRAIVDRIDAGESVAELADDYDLTPVEIEQAVVYEQAA